MSSSLVSICIPTFNGEKHLVECLDSALAQTYSDIEIIITDDCSTDYTNEIAEKYRDRDMRIKYFVNEKNLGLVGNWNRCMQLASGQWIKFLFQDDVLNSRCVNSMMKTADENVDFIVCDRNFIFDDDIAEEFRRGYSKLTGMLQRFLGNTSPCFVEPKKIARLVSKFVYANFIGEPTATMFRKSIIMQWGNFNSGLVQICDYEYWLRITSNVGMCYIPEALASFRVHNKSASADNRRTELYQVDRIILLHIFLYDKWFEKMRGFLTAYQKRKMKEMFKLKIFETVRFIKQNPHNNMIVEHYFNVRKELPRIIELEHSSIRAKLIYAAVKLRRKFRKKY